MKVSAKNQLKGKIVDVTKGGHRARVRIEISGVITASITNDAAAELGLQKGDEAWAIIHASDVMLGK
jgi:molybdopterin-binding protein